MEIVIALIVVAVVGFFIWSNRSVKGLDVNNDGKVNTTDLEVAVQNTVSAAKEVADANKDGVVDTKDVEVIAEKAKTEVKKAATKAKTAVKKATGRGRKPKAQK